MGCVDREDVPARGARRRRSVSPDDRDDADGRDDEGGEPEQQAQGVRARSATLLVRLSCTPS